MDSGNLPKTELIKQREIYFSELCKDPLKQAEHAISCLDDISGIQSVSAVSTVHIQEFLRKIGFHLDNSLLFRLQRALWYYTEFNQRTMLGCEQNNGHSTQQVFINRYERLKHGCRDHRPEHLRQYR